MSNQAIDFTAVVADLEEAGKKLDERKEKKTGQSKSVDKDRELQREGGEAEHRGPNKTAERKKAKTPAFQVHVDQRPVRTPLTLKVLEVKAQQFNELFYRLKAMKDTRTKQQLADEAIELLLAKYKVLLSRGA